MMEAITITRLRFAVLWAAILLPLPGVKAQTVLGPFDAYVSRQNPGKVRLFSGESPLKAGQGQQVRLRISSIQGPISIEPASYDLDGPSCSGQASDAKNTEEKTANFQGNIKITTIPAAGSTVHAQFSIKDEGVSTDCATGLKSYYPNVHTVKLNIHSILLQMAFHKLTIHQDSSATISIFRQFPDSGGFVSFQSLNGKIKLANQGDGVKITALNSGADAVIATLTVGNAIYRDTVKIQTAPRGNDSLFLLKNADIQKTLDAQKAETKAKDELIKNNQKEIVRLQYIVKRSERIIFICVLLLMVIMIIAGVRSYLKRVKIHKRIMEEISYIQSHKIRAPIARILGLTQLFNPEDLTDPINKEVIGYISFTTHELDGLVKEIIKKSESHNRPPISANL